MGQCLDSRLADSSLRFGQERHATESIATTAAECRQTRQFDLTLAKWATEDYGDDGDDNGGNNHEDGDDVFFVVDAYDHMICLGIRT